MMGEPETPATGTARWEGKIVSTQEDQACVPPDLEIPLIGVPPPMMMLLYRSSGDKSKDAARS